MTSSIRRAHVREKLRHMYPHSLTQPKPTFTSNRRWCAKALLPNCSHAPTPSMLYNRLLRPLNARPVLVPHPCCVLWQFQLSWGFHSLRDAVVPTPALHGIANLYLCARLFPKQVTRRKNAVSPQTSILTRNRRKT